MAQRVPFALAAKLIQTTAHLIKSRIEKHRVKILCFFITAATAVGALTYLFI